MEKFGKNRLSIGVLVAVLGVWVGCSDDPAGPTLDEEGPSFVTTAPLAERMTGGGRVDYPPGSAQKNQGPEKRYQTWGLTLNPDGTSQLQFVDHREGNRPQCGGRPCNFHSVTFESFTATDNSCVEGGLQARGTLREKNTDTPWQFRLDVCDNGEPGHKAPPRDRLELCISEFPDSDGPAGECTYHVRDLFNPPNGAQLTGGNTQTHGIVSTTSTSTASSEAFGLHVDAATGSLARSPYAVLPGSGMDTDEALELSVAGLAEASNLFATSTGVPQDGDGSADAHSTAEDVNLLEGLVTAEAVVAMSSSVLSGSIVESSPEGSSFTNLVVNGVAIDPGVAPNTRIDIPGVGTVVLNEQLPSGDGLNSTGLKVNMIHVLLKDSITGETTGEIIVGSASTAVSN